MTTPKKLRPTFDVRTCNEEIGMVIERYERSLLLAAREIARLQRRIERLKQPKIVPTQVPTGDPKVVRLRCQ